MFKSFFNKSDKDITEISFKDPVCGMQTTDEVVFEYKNRVYTFCSDYCRQQFEKELEKYSNK